MLPYQLWFSTTLYPNIDSPTRIVNIIFLHDLSGKSLFSDSHTLKTQFVFDSRRLNKLFSNSFKLKNKKNTQNIHITYSSKDTHSITCASEKYLIFNVGK